MSENLTTRAFSALRWGYAGLMVKTVSTFVSGIVLARLLGPNPFGQVAAAALIFGLANMLADAGFASALVQAAELDESDVRFAFTFQLTIGVLLTVSCALLAPFFAAVLRDPLIEPIVRTMSLIFVLQGFGQTASGLLKRRLAVRSLQTAQVISSVAGYAVVGIVAALLGAGVWSLVAAQLVQAFCYSLMVYFHVRHSVVPCWKSDGLRLARFGIKVTGLNILNWSISNVDNAFVARAFGPTALGLYSRACNTVSTPSEAVVSTLQQVLFASCSRAANRADAIRTAYLGAISAVCLLIFPVCWSVAVCAPVVVAAIYGARWAGAAYLIRPLAFAISIHTLMSMAGPMLGAANLVQREVKAQALTVLVAAAAFGISSHYSAVVLAWAVLGVYIFRFVTVTQPALRLLKLRWPDLLRVLLAPLAAACLITGSVWGAEQVAASYSASPLLTLLILCLTGALVGSMLVIFAGDRLLCSELVDVLSRISLSIPQPIERWLTGIRRLQATRAVFAEPVLHKAVDI